MEALIHEIARQGILGLVTAVALWVAWKKDRQVEVLYSRWVEKSDKQTEKYHELAAEMTATIKELAHAQCETEEELEKLRKKLPTRSE